MCSRSLSRVQASEWMIVATIASASFGSAPAASRFRIAAWVSIMMAIGRVYQ